MLRTVRMPMRCPGTNNVVWNRSSGARSRPTPMEADQSQWEPTMIPGSQLTKALGSQPRPTNAPGSHIIAAPGSWPRPLFCRETLINDIFARFWKKKFGLRVGSRTFLYLCAGSWSRILLVPGVVMSHDHALSFNDINNKDGDDYITDCVWVSR